MKITHKLPKLNQSKDCDISPVCILSNNLGGFLFISEPVMSKYNGFFFNDNLELYKTVENIGIVGSGFDEVENSLTHIRRKHKGNAERIECPEGANGMIYTLAKRAGIFIDFDFRRVNDMREFGRYYDIRVDKGNIIVRFSKKTDGKEDSSHLVEEFQFFAVVQPKGFDVKSGYRFIDQWHESSYHYDDLRKDFPASRHVYRPFIVDAKELLIAFGRTEEEALAELGKLKRSKQAKRDYGSVDKKKNPEAAAAFICAQDSLGKLKLVHDGVERIYAGYPWFFQLWSRDENISLGALIKLRRFKTVKGIIFRYVECIGKDGRLPNHIPSPHLGSADGVGWFWKRVGDLIAELKELRLLEKYISPAELRQLKDSLAESIKRIEKNFKSDDLITNKAKETWMDTDCGGQDPRDGARIEVQALHLSMLRLMHELSGDKKYRTREEKMKKAVKGKFWNGAVLADGAGDFNIRPNVFIAYYAYPDLLSRREWQICFENALAKLWLDWGGLSSIDKEHVLFRQEYTGKTNESYHRGDSWYWLNNLAALCMFRNNAIDFEDRILRIIEASSEEMLWHGAVGHHAEISSASHLSSYGCLAQAWSAAIFIELISEVYGK
ncbi:MAG: hypothetical protein KKD17_02160 [Nanoarchaeota archaeon]|nr:hypothetical protein [Nanoarchaeota archaeon]